MEQLIWSLELQFTGRSDAAIKKMLVTDPALAVDRFHCNGSGPNGTYEYLAEEYLINILI